MTVQLFALAADGPVALSVPAGATSHHELFDGLALGVYSALRTFEHERFLALDWHLERTERSMQLLGWSEPKVITRFLILAIIFALLSLTTLKLR